MQYTRLKEIKISVSYVNYCEHSEYNILSIFSMPLNINSRKCRRH